MSVVRNPTKKQKISPLVSEIVFGGPPRDPIEAVKRIREHKKMLEKILFVLFHQGM